MPSTNKQEWNEGTFEPVRKRFGERRDRFETDSGIEVDTVYTPEDLKSFDYADALGYPGEYPYTRGVQPNMYRGRVWTMRQYSGFASPEESNARYRYLLEHGQTGLSVAFDLPTQTGYDSDHPLAKRARSGARASPYPASPTWRCSSRASPSTRSAPR